MRLGWENVRGGYYIKKLFSAVNALKDKVLPNVTASDNGKTLVVADGAWSLGEGGSGNASYVYAVPGYYSIGSQIPEEYFTPFSENVYLYGGVGFITINNNNPYALGVYVVTMVAGCQPLFDTDVQIYIDDNGVISEGLS